MNELINAWPSAVPPLPSVPVPCILSKCFKPDWEVKGTEEEWGEPQMQLAASPLPGGHSSLTFLPKARRSLSVEVKGLWASISSPRSLWLSPMSHGKAKATQGWWGRSIAAEGEDRGHLSYLVSPHRGSPPWRCCFQQPCVFAEAVFNFLFLWAKWWIELASRSVPTWVVVLSTWLLAASLGARRAQYTLRHISSMRPDPKQFLRCFSFCGSFSFCPSWTLPFGLADSDHGLSRCHCTSIQTPLCSYFSLIGYLFPFGIFLAFFEIFFFPSFMYIYFIYHYFTGIFHIFPLWFSASLFVTLSSV